MVFKLKTEDGQTVGLVVRDFFKGFAGPGDCKGIQVKVYSSSVRFLFRVESPCVLALLRRILQNMVLPIRRSGPA